MFTSKPLPIQHNTQDILSLDQTFTTLYEAPQWVSDSDSDSPSYDLSPILNFCSSNSDLAHENEFSLQFNYHRVPPCTSLPTLTLVTPPSPTTIISSKKCDPQSYFLPTSTPKPSTRHFNHRRTVSAPVSLTLSHSFAHFDLFDDGKAYSTYNNNQEFESDPTLITTTEPLSPVIEENENMVTSTKSPIVNLSNIPEDSELLFVLEPELQIITSVSPLSALEISAPILNDHTILSRRTSYSKKAKLRRFLKSIFN